MQINLKIGFTKITGLIYHSIFDTFIAINFRITDKNTTIPDNAKRAYRHDSRRTGEDVPDNAGTAKS